jgi:hypothetical protein
MEERAADAPRATATGERAALWFLFAAAAILLSLTLREPFVHHLDTCGTQVGFMARNVLKFGPALRDVSGPTLDAYADPVRHAYVNHPPLVYWCVALAMKAIGPTTAAVKFTAIAFSLGALGAFLALARRLLDGPAAFVAAALLAATPMFAYVSVASVHQAPTLFFILLVLLAYWQWRRTGRLRWIGALLAAQAAGCWTDWPAYYAAPVLLLHDAISRRTLRSPMWLALAMNFACFESYLLYVHAINPIDGVERLLGSARSRSALPALDDYLRGEARNMGKYFTAALLAAAAGGALTLRRHPRGSFILLLPLLSLDQILFATECSKHDYYAYYWGPALALWAAWFGQRLWAGGAGGRGFAALLLAGGVVQSAWQMTGLITRTGAYDFYYAMAQAIEEETRPDARVLIVPDNLGLYTPFYADRYCLTWNGRHLKASDTTPPIFEGTEAELVQWLRDNPRRATHVVWATAGEVREQFAFTEWDADKLARFRVGQPGPLADYLDGFGPLTRTAHGFRITRHQRSAPRAP